MRRSTRVVIGSAVVIAVTAAVPTLASAALCARWDRPDTAAVGSSITISFRTYVPTSVDGGGYKLDPYPFPDYPFRVRAVSPSERAINVAMAPTGTDASKWSGQLTPVQAGSWALQIVNLEGADAACYAEMPLVVTVARSSPLAGYLLILLIGLATTAAIGAFMLLRRRRATSQPPRR